MNFDALTPEEKEDYMKAQQLQQKMAQEYPAPSRMNYDSKGIVYTNPVHTGAKSSDYLYGAPLENIEKTGRLRALAKVDPAMGRRIATLTNRFLPQGGSYVAHAPLGNRDMYAKGQDAYLIEMQRLGLMGDTVETEDENPKTMRKMSAKAKGVQR